MFLSNFLWRESPIYFMMAEGDNFVNVNYCSETLVAIVNLWTLSQKRECLRNLIDFYVYSGPLLNLSIKARAEEISSHNI